MERVFFPFDEELKTELDQIKLAIQGEQNGMATQSMGQMAYKKNYGVPYISLRKIASNYSPNKKLANCLWGISYRETMLLALLLFPKEEMSFEETIALVDDMNEMELAEFACRDLLCLVPSAEKLVFACLEKESPFALEVAFLLAARLLEKNLALDSMSNLMGCVDNALGKGKATLAKSVSNYLKQLGIFADYTTMVMDLVDKLSNSESLQLRWVAEEVRTFVEYTEHKK